MIKRNKIKQLTEILNHQKLEIHNLKIIAMAYDRMCKDKGINKKVEVEPYILEIAEEFKIGEY